MTGLFVGTYAWAGGPGLCELVQAPDGGWRLGETYAGAANASHGARSARFGLHYLVNEQRHGMLEVHRHDASGWQHLGGVATEGAGPCFVALDCEETVVAVANYCSGDIALFRLDPETGMPAGPPELRRHEGSGPDSERQEAPHAHCVAFSPDGRWLYHVDLGTDAVIAYPFDSARGALGPGQVAFQAPPGTGPRHLVFHPRLPLALLIGELSSTLTCLMVADGALVPKHGVSTLPAGFTGKSLGGHLALSATGDRVYVSNRGHDSIALFDLDDTGVLALRQHVASGGVSPRFFLCLDEECLIIVAHEESEDVTMFACAEDGMLTQLGGAIPIPGAAFVGTMETGR
jgi:6-phosphogluconolactonase